VNALNAKIHIRADYYGPQGTHVQTRSWRCWIRIFVKISVMAPDAATFGLSVMTTVGKGVYS
jgi:hypothetical protein